MPSNGKASCSATTYKTGKRCAALEAGEGQELRRAVRVADQAQVPAAAPDGQGRVELPQESTRRCPMVGDPVVHAERGLPREELQPPLVGEAEHRQPPAQVEHATLLGRVQTLGPELAVVRVGDAADGLRSVAGGLRVVTRPGRNLHTHHVG